MGVNQLKAKLPIYEGDSLSFEKVMKFLNLSPAELAALIQVSEATIRRPRITKNTLKKAQPLIYALNLMYDLFEDHKDRAAEIRRFLHEPRKEWKGHCPMDLLQQGNVAGVTSFLERIHDGETLGS